MPTRLQKLVERQNNLIKKKEEFKEKYGSNNKKLTENQLQTKEKLKRQYMDVKKQITALKKQVGGGDIANSVNTLIDSKQTEFDELRNNVYSTGYSFQGMRMARPLSKNKRLQEFFGQLQKFFNADLNKTFLSGTRDELDELFETMDNYGYMRCSNTTITPAKTPATTPAKTPEKPPQKQQPTQDEITRLEAEIFPHYLSNVIRQDFIEGFDVVKNIKPKPESKSYMRMSEYKDLIRENFTRYIRILNDLAKQKGKDQELVQTIKKYYETHNPVLTEEEKKVTDNRTQVQYMNQLTNS